MVGVEFELKKLSTKKRGYLGATNAYIISAVVTESPMTLYMVMVFALWKVVQVAGASYGSQEIFLVTTTCIMIFSLILSNMALMFTSRYISDCVYEEWTDQTPPSSYGFIFYLVIAGVLTGIPYVLSLEIPPVHKVLNLLQFGIMLIVWVQISYPSAIKKYTRALLGFLMAAAVSVGLAVMLSFVGINTLTAPFLTSVVGFFVITSMYIRELVCFYPKGEIDSFVFFPSPDKYKIPTAAGFFMAAGLLGHNSMYWFSDYWAEMTRGIVYCTKCDMPCFSVNITIIPSLTIFVVSLEMNFYKAYRRCSNNIQYGGALSSIRFERTAMEKTLSRELARVFEVQFFVEIVCVSFLGNAPRYIGFERGMPTIYRYLCSGHCFYMLLRSLIILLLYLDDRKGVCLLSMEFTVLSMLFSVIALRFDIEAYGVGFLTVAVVTPVCGLVYLHRCIQKLEYRVFCGQSLFYKKTEGVFRKASFQVRKLEKKFEKRLMETKRKQ